MIWICICQRAWCFCVFFVVAGLQMQDDGEIESENSGRYSLWRHRGHMGVFSILMLLVLQYCNSQQEKTY